MSLIPPHFLNTIVSIEVEGTNQQGTSEMKPIATGFLLGRFLDKDTAGQSRYRIFLVTNRHVFEDNAGNRKKEIQLRFNITGKQAKHYKVDLLDAANKPTWQRHKNVAVDIAIIPIVGPALQSEGIDYNFFRDDTDAFLAREFDDKGISTGDGIFVLGFPLGQRGIDRNYAIVRQGVIARVDEELLKDHYYFIDASAYPGNSGGPVISRPEMVSIQGTKSCTQAGLVGVISSGVVYSEVAVSQQTGEPRIIFTEQTGLVRIVPIESVLEVIDDYIKTLPALVAAATPAPSVPET